MPFLKGLNEALALTATKLVANMPRVTNESSISYQEFGLVNVLLTGRSVTETELEIPIKHARGPTVSYTHLTLPTICSV